MKTFQRRWRTNSLPTTMTLEDVYLEPEKTISDLHSDAASCTSSSETEDDSTTESMNSEAAAWGSVLAGALRRAARQGRLTCGLVAAAQVLERAPSSVRLCVLAPPSASGGLLHLHSVLLEAHCYENDIPTVKVDSVEKLAAIVGPSCECILVHNVRQANHGNKKMTSAPGICKMETLQKGTAAVGLGENGLIAAAREGTHPSVLVLPVTPPP
ncbi:hypothetical protein B566_EDAN008769 [Ephemera danica]|nr:hypothetical protein B566_EDAN008769 [Ephemera danica]